MTTLRSQPAYPVARPVPVVTARQRIVGAFALLGLLALLVGVPFLLHAAHRFLWPDLTWEDLQLRLASPDDGTLLAMLLTLVLWVAWAWLAVTVLIELVAALRRAPAPRLPGLPQAFASRLVATASMMLASLPTVTQAVAPPASAVVLPAEAPTADVKVAQVVALTQHRASAPGPSATSPGAPTVDVAAVPGQASAAGPVDYTVRPGDTLWRIARERLGDPRRWAEIADLNPYLADPDFLEAGMVLRVPASTPPSQVASAVSGSATYEVRPGDTLSQVALDELGDATRYPEIAEASATTVQPDGDRLTDPDHIEPGWTLTIPGVGPGTPPPVASETVFVEEPHASGDGVAPDRTAPDEPDDAAGPGQVVAPPKPAGPTGHEREAGAVVGQETSAGRPADDSAASVAAQAAPSWLLPGLTGAGAVLAASLFAASRRNRAAQWRYRRPGRLVAPIPPEAVPAERTAVVHGSGVIPDVERLDLLLKALAGPCLEPGSGPRPPVVAVELTPSDAVVHLDEPADLSAPWTGAGTRWSAPLSAATEGARGETPPYPLLVTIGQDAAGHTWLVDLERARRVSVTGDPGAALALGRAVAAELNLCPWACNTTTHTLGFAHEAQDLSEVRGHAHREPDTACMASTVLAAVTDSLDMRGDDREWFHLVLTDADHAGEVAEVRKALVPFGLPATARAGAVVMQCGGTAADGDLEIAVGHGRLRIDALGLDLAAVGLTQTELEASVALVVTTDSLDDASAPSMPDGPHAGVADVTGNLLPAVTTPRPSDPDEAAGGGSLLPGPTAAYVESAATLAEDVERLAPVVPPETTEHVLSADERLDRDVADWFAGRAPRVMALGPVTARARSPRRAEKKWPQILATLTYLMHHPDGVTGPQAADSLGEPSSKVRTYVSFLRAWFGTDPRTRRPHVPKANETRGYAERGVQCYQLEGVLYDVDLFRRLRTRGQARGADGLDDLMAALRLVRGRPFQGVEANAVWQWAFQSRRVDLELTAAIIDVAHIVADHGFESDDLDLVETAVAAAKLVAPDDDVVVNDETRLLWMQGHTELARRRQRDLLDGADDGSDLGPIEAPERTRRMALAPRIVDEPSSARSSGRRDE